MICIGCMNLLTEAVINAIGSCSSECVGHGFEWAGIAGLTALTSLVGVSSAFHTAGSLLCTGGTGCADLCKRKVKM